MTNPYCIDTIEQSETRSQPSVPSWRQWTALGLRKAASDALALIVIMETWAERARERRRLSGLDERMLRDIGISHADAWREARKPFWRA